AAERQEVKQVLGGRGQRDYGRDIVRVGRSNTLKGAMQRIRSRQRESLAGLRIVLQTLQLSLRNIQKLSGYHRALASLIINELAGVNRETGSNRTIEKIGFREAEHNIPLQAADVGLNGECLSHPEKVVRSVAEPDKCPSQAAHPAGKAYLVLTLLFYFESQVYQSLFLVKM